MNHEIFKDLYDSNDKIKKLITDFNKTEIIVQGDEKLGSDKEVGRPKTSAKDTVKKLAKKAVQGKF